MDANLDRKEALRALMWCDQLEQAVQEGDQMVIEIVKHQLMERLENCSSDDLRVVIHGGRLLAHEALDDIP